MKVQLSRNVTQKINSADFEEKLRIYGEEGIWYDLITELAKRKMSDPQNIDVFTLWSDLLNEEDVVPPIRSLSTAHQSLVESGLSPQFPPHP